MENVHEFESWLNQCIEDSKKRLGIADRTLTYILLREGLNYYLRTMKEDGIRDTTKHS